MKKAVIAIIAVIIVAGGAFAIFHMSPKPAASTSSQSANQTNAASANDAVLITKTNAALGQYLAGPNNMALYTYGADTQGVSNCTGSCLKAWPAYIDKGSTTNLPTGVGTIKRTDNGEIQYTYNGMPLYYFASDSAGQVTGNGVQNFSVAKPAATSSSSSESTPPGSSAGSTSSNSGASW